MVGRREDLLDPLVDLADDVEQVAPGLLEVLELLGEELVALLERGELLEGQRVDPAEQGQRPVGGTGPLLLLLADVGHGLWLRRLEVDLVTRRQRGGDQLVRTVLGEQGLGVDAVLLQRPGLHRLDPQPLLGAGDLVAVHRAGQLLHLVGQLAQPAAYGGHLGVDGRARLLGRGTSGGRADEGTLEPGQGVVGTLRDGSGDRELAGPARPTDGCPLARRALLDRSAFERVGAAGQRASALLARADREPGVDLVLPGPGGGHGEGVTVVGHGPVVDRSRLGGREAFVQLREGSTVLAQRLLRDHEGRLGTFGLAERPRRRAELAELLGDGRHAGVGLVQPDERGLDPLGRLPLLVARTRSNRIRSARCVASPSRLSASSTAALTSINEGSEEEPPCAKPAPSTSPARVTAVTDGSAATSARASARPSTTAIRASSRRHVSGQRRRGLDEIGGAA